MLKRAYPCQNRIAKAALHKFLPDGGLVTVSFLNSCDVFPSLTNRVVPCWAMISTASSFFIRLCADELIKNCAPQYLTRCAILINLVSCVDIVLNF